MQITAEDERIITGLIDEALEEDRMQKGLEKLKKQGLKPLPMIIIENHVYGAFEDVDGTYYILRLNKNFDILDNVLDGTKEEITKEMFYIMEHSRPSR